MTNGSDATDNPTVAYAAAPGITSEIGWVIRHSIPRSSGTEYEREFLLRKAAAFDRMALAEAARCAPQAAAPTIESAVEAARQLMDHDVAHCGLSLRGAEIATADDCRAYVRREYHAWNRTQPL
ncbi:hypothetical protein B7P34_20185 [Streptosporangium nondiastaticum]|uniref:Uncharacterized protein n=1 Tax=Streptosporangium nondiastaticum TaxID=35764 RepID=A0A9X7JNI5_9ACTN|nr:hypothetical protein [Streptosporangium nondiastaticum]PSJ26973.1 hypothetical protein B7P34_20185 [Streptosporangium nondiastaticum]